MALQTTPIVRGTVTAALTPVYTVPAGKVSILKKLILHNTNLGVEHGFTLRVTPAGEANSAEWDVIRNYLLNDSIFNMDLSAPLLEGDVVSIQGDPLTQIYLGGIETDP